jgi:preprotein translocase subunit YajC
MGFGNSSRWSLGLWLGCLAVSAHAQEGGATEATAGPQSFWVELFSNPVTFLLLFMVLFYLLLIVPNYRSSKKTQRELEERLSNLKKNDRVVTSFGVHGVVAAINSDSGTVTLRIDENTNAKLTVNRETIRAVKKD